MEPFEVNILGCGSATPTYNHLPSSQIVQIRGKYLMIDCGEGTQLQLRKNKINFNKLNHIFISHLHGDHCFGLIGFISTMDLMGRTAPLFIHAFKELEELLVPWLKFFCKGLSYEVHFDNFEKNISKIIFQDRSIEVISIPLKHRISTSGFLIKEKPLSNHIRKDMMDLYKIPLSKVPEIKEGADFFSEEIGLIPNANLVRLADPSRSYAYISDTAYKEDIISLIKGVDLLYHESTFAETEKDRALKTLHSTAKQAAVIAKKAEVKKLMLGHYSARYHSTNILLQEAKTIFLNTIASNEGLKVKI